MEGIPGLGQLPAQPSAGSTRRIQLHPFGEWRFQAPFDAPPVEVRLLSGTAEKDGTELALQHVYVFSGLRSKINSWHGCELEVSGKCEAESVAQYARPTDSELTSYLNLHLQLARRRQDAAASASASSASASSSSSQGGPRVLVAGARGSGKSSVARCLTAWATRTGLQPLVVNADPHEGMLALPGTLSAAVFATLMDIESASGGWGDAPTSGPSAVPVKTPVVVHFGRARPEDDVVRYKQAVSRIAGVATARLSADPEVKRAGMVVDAPGFEEDGGEVAVDVLAHIVEELSINIVVVLGAEELCANLDKRLRDQTTSLGEPIAVVGLDRSDGAVVKDEDFCRQERETAIKEYFFGGTNRTLSPSTQTVEGSTLTIYRIPDDSIPNDAVPGALIRTPPCSEMEAGLLAVMAASVRDSAEAVGNAVVLGFVYVADVDQDRGRVRILAPVGGSLADRPMVWGRWPDSFFNLLA